MKERKMKGTPKQKERKTWRKKKGRDSEREKRKERDSE
jgi:hypothetical protein